MFSVIGFSMCSTLYRMKERRIVAHLINTFRYATKEALALSNKHSLAPASSGLKHSCRISLQSKSIWLIATEQHNLSVPFCCYWTNFCTSLDFACLSFWVLQSRNVILLHIIFGTVKTGVYVLDCIGNRCVSLFLIFIFFCALKRSQNKLKVSVDSTTFYLSVRKEIYCLLFSLNRSHHLIENSFNLLSFLI